MPPYSTGIPPIVKLFSPSRSNLNPSWIHLSHERDATAPLWRVLPLVDHVEGLPLEVGRSEIRALNASPLNVIFHMLSKERPQGVNVKM